MSYVLHIYRMTYKTYDMQEYIFVHPEEWYSMSPILRDLFVSSFGHSEWLQQHKIHIGGAMKIRSATFFLLPLHPGIKLGYLVNGC